MDQPVSFLERLGLRQDDADERAIRRAYARELKLIDQEADPEGFQSLREVYEYALAWQRHRAAALDEVAEQPAPAPAAAEPIATAPPQPPAPIAEPVQDDAAEAAAVFAEFQQHCLGIPSERPALPQGPWIRELERSLDDPRLIPIIARDLFEQHIAHLLADGWQPGHEALLVAAIKVFQWQKDRRRVLALGQVGHIIDASIQERDNYDLQPYEQREAQRQLIERLRDAKPPRSRELIRQLPQLELMIARFPNWLALITSVANIRAWRQQAETLPAWRRKLGGRAPAQEKPASRRSGFGWMGVAVIVVMVLFIVAGQSDHTPRTSPQVVSNNYLLQGIGHLQQNQLPDAISSFGHAAREDRGNAKAYAYQALALVLNGDEYNAEHDLEKAQKLDPNEPIAYHARGLLAKKRKRYDEAIAAFSKLLQLQPGRAAILLLRAESYFDQADYPRALADIEQVLILDRNDASAEMLRAAVLQKQGDQTGAAKAIDKAMTLKPSAPKLYQQAVDFYLGRQQRDKALKVLDVGIQTIPDTALYLQRARLRPRTDLAAALRDVDHVIALKPVLLDAIHLRAELAFNGGDWKEAVTGLDKSLTQQTFDSRAKTVLLTLRGIIYQKKGELKLAQQDFDSARTSAKSAADLGKMCNMLAMNKSALDTALEVCDASLARTASNTFTLDSKGMALLQLGRYKDAIEVYSTAIRFGDPASAWYGRAVARQRLGDIAGSRADAAEARKHAPGVAADYTTVGLKLPPS